MHKSDQEKSAQARKANAEHLVKCGTRKEKSTKKTTVRIACEREFHRGQRSMAKRAAEALKYKKTELNSSKRKDPQFTMDWRNAEITVDSVWQARAKLCDNKVNGAEDAVVTEMMKQLPLEKIYTITRCFQERFMGLMETPSSWKIMKFVFLRKPDAEPKKRIGSYRSIASTSVMSSGTRLVLFCVWKRKRT